MSAQQREQHWAVRKPPREYLSYMHVSLTSCQMQKPMAACDLDQATAELVLQALHLQRMQRHMCSNCTSAPAANNTSAP